MVILKSTVNPFVPDAVNTPKMSNFINDSSGGISFSQIRDLFRAIYFVVRNIFCA